MSDQAVDGYYFEALVHQQASKEAILFFHGYPANLGIKNRDIAERAFSVAGLDCFIIHYPGLGNSPGRFSFQKAIECSYSLATSLLEKYSKLKIFGHSFGGLVACEISARLKSKVESVCLVSPFNFFPEGDAFRHLIDAVYIQTSALIPNVNQEEFWSDAQVLLAKHNPRNMIDALDIERRHYLIIQAKNDEEVPAWTTADFVTKFKHANIKYAEWLTDHSFTEMRRQLADIFIEFISSKS